MPKPNIKFRTGELYWHYKEWAKQIGEEVLKQRQFGMQLSERGFKAARDGRTRYRLGIGFAKKGDAGDVW
jgi:phage/plasmid-associated DNA primase